MGNINTKETDTINWKSISTDKFDGNLKQYGGEESYRLSNESKLLLNRLNNAKVEKNIIINDKNFSDIFSPNFNENNKITSQVGGGNNIENSLSDTSPFISSEMYNILMKKNGDNIQVGGGMIEGDDSSTSSTSSSSDNKKKSTKKLKSVNKKYFSNKESKSNETTPNDNSSTESKDLSYVSSSAHTEGNESDSGGTHANTESLPRTISEKEEPSASEEKSSPVEDKTSSAEETSTPIVETPSPAEETPSPVEETSSPEKSKNVKESETNNESETNQQTTTQSESENKGDSNASTESDSQESPIKSDTKQKISEESSPEDSNVVSQSVTQAKTDNQSETLIDSHKTTENTDKLEKKGGYSKKKKNIRKKVNKKKIESITNENSNLPPSSINTSDINMISDF